VNTSLSRSANYFNRELSWLAFNSRVLEEAADSKNPLLERVKFLAITASNLDEFFEIRVSSLLQRIEDGYADTAPDGLTPQMERDRLAEALQDYVAEQYRCWNQGLRPQLAEHGVRVLSLDELDGPAREFVERYCLQELDPLLTPVTVDPAHPFPRVINKALCQALLLRRRRRASESYMGVVTVPRALPRLIKLPSQEGTDDYIALADLVELHTARMYRGYDILAQGSFRITRNSNLYVQEEESRNLLESVRTELHNRRRGDAVRLEIQADAGAEITERLREIFEIDEWQIFKAHGPVNLSRLSHLYDETDRPDLKFKPYVAREWALPKGSNDVFEALRQKDVLLHHPFDSYTPVVSFIEAAAEDPKVLSIKQTLYRTNEKSPIIDALVDAAASKEVTTVIEVKARFDEASNIRWARTLEDAGVQVFHGLVGLKTHCKLALVARKDPDGVIRRYAHLGTGNYNPITAQFYTDISLMTANEEITTAVHRVFNFLTAYSEQSSYDPLLVAPLEMAERIAGLIRREADHARDRQPARIIAKMNSLLDKDVISELYEASRAGVQIDLIVRGICTLRPGVRGLSDNIRVRSIVGRFLEHSRIFYFENSENPEIYLGSADWMPRNLYERVETLFPIRDTLLKDRIRHEILAPYLVDNAKARVLHADGSYALNHPRAKTGQAFSAQDFLIAVAEGKKSIDAIPVEPGHKPVRRTRTRARAR
jgi:polyphosphate kinase